MASKKYMRACTRLEMEHVNLGSCIRIDQRQNQSPKSFSYFSLSSLIALLLNEALPLFRSKTGKTKEASVIGYALRSLFLPLLYIQSKLYHTLRRKSFQTSISQVILEKKQLDPEKNMIFSFSPDSSRYQGQEKK